MRIYAHDIMYRFCTGFHSRRVRYAAENYVATVFLYFHSDRRLSTPYIRVAPIWYFNTACVVGKTNSKILSSLINCTLGRPTWVELWVTTNSVRPLIYLWDYIMRAHTAADIFSIRLATRGFTQQDNKYHNFSDQFLKNNILETYENPRRLPIGVNTV